MVFLNAGMKRVPGMSVNFIRQRLDPREESALVKQLRYKAVEQETLSSP